MTKQTVKIQTKRVNVKLISALEKMGYNVVVVLK